MAWAGEIKSVYLDLPADLHAEMRSAAPRRGITAREAYIEAATEWLGMGAGASENKAPEALADLSPADRQIVTNLIAMIRDGETEKLPPVRLLLKNYKPKEKPDVPKPAQEGGQHRRRA